MAESMGTGTGSGPGGAVGTPGEATDPEAKRPRSVLALVWGHKQKEAGTTTADRTDADVRTAESSVGRKASLRVVQRPSSE